MNELGELVYKPGVVEGRTRVLNWAEEGVKLNLVLGIIKGLRGVLSVLRYILLSD